MQMPDYQRFFQCYVDFYNDALEGKPVIDGLRACYAEYLVSASTGQVMGGENGKEYGQVLEKGFDFYRAIGVQEMRFRQAVPREIIPDHDEVRVSLSAVMRKKDGTPLTIDFDGVYFLQRRDSGPKIFCFVSEDEMAVFREHGFVDDKGQPI